MRGCSAADQLCQSVHEIKLQSAGQAGEGEGKAFVAFSAFVASFIVRETGQLWGTIGGIN